MQLRTEHASHANGQMGHVGRTECHATFNGPCKPRKCAPFPMNLLRRQRPSEEPTEWSGVDFMLMNCMLSPNQGSSVMMHYMKAYSPGCAGVRLRCMVNRCLLMPCMPCHGSDVYISMRMPCPPRTARITPQLGQSQHPLPL